MNSYLPLVAIVLRILLPAPVPEQESRLSLRPAWQRKIPAAINDIHLSSTGRCVAVATSENIVVVDSAGKDIWRWNFKKDNRFVVAQKIAVSPNCEWVAFAGDPDYRYVWIIHRSGRRIPIKTQGTPLALAISHSGSSVVIGTGAGILVSYTSAGTLRWKVAEQTYIPIEEVSISDDNRAILISGYEQAVIAATGKTIWSGGEEGFGSMRAARDFKTFVAWGQPTHGPGVGRISLFDAAGGRLWTRVATLPQAVISPAGDLVVAQINENQSPSDEDGFSPAAERLPRALQLLSKTGTVVRSFHAPGYPIAFSSDGLRFVLRQDDGLMALDLNGKALWHIAASEFLCEQWTPDLHAVVIAQENRLEWYLP